MCAQQGRAWGPMACRLVTTRSASAAASLLAVPGQRHGRFSRKGCLIASASYVCTSALVAIAFARGAGVHSDQVRPRY